MTQPGDPKSSSTGRPGDDFRKIDGVGRRFEQRLWDAGIFTYRDLAQRTPEEIAAVLAPMAGISPERISSQARELAGSPPEAPSRASTMRPSTSNSFSSPTTASAAPKFISTKRTPETPGQDGMRSDCSPSCATGYRCPPRQLLPMRPVLSRLMHRQEIRSLQTPGPHLRASRQPPFPAACRPCP